MRAPIDPHAAAADPRRSSWASANAGSGKTSTLVARVARLLLAGSEPQRILCLTYTRAAAAEMQRRLFRQLGSWAVMDDAALAGELAAIGEEGRDLSSARRLFARALETPGGLKIGTIHAFCQGLLSRFPLEAGVAPGFTVTDEGEARAMAVRARALMAEAAMARPDHPLAKAYVHFAVALSFDEFETLLKDLSFRRRRQIADLLEREGTLGPWKRCGFESPVDPEALEKEAVQRTRWRRWRWAIEALEASNKSTDQNLAATMKAVEAESSFEALKAVFFTRGGEIRKHLGTQSAAPQVRGWLADEQARIGETVERIKAARCAEETSHAFVIATAWSELYEGAKAERRALDYDDLIERARDLLTRKADAAWVLYKLDGGIDHLLLDEAQDTSPEQWEVITALTAGFFDDAGAGARERTIFAVGDEKQSIFAFQGARPERFAIERAGFEARASAAGRGFTSVPLLASYRSAPGILRFVDEVFADPVAARGLRPQGKTLAGLEIRHKPVRRTAGSVELWPEEKDDAKVEFDPWEGTEVEITSGKRVKLARRIAAEIIARVKRQEAVFEADGDGGEIERPCEWRDFLILVRSRGALYEEIIRALKLAGAPVGGADRMVLAEHGLVIDLMALAWFVLHPADDLSLAAVLRGPLCEVDEDSLFALARDRPASLWEALRRRAAERPEWASAAERLDWALSEAAGRPPFDFYGALLSRLDEKGRSMRQRLLTRMGAEAEDALGAFMEEALAAERRGVRDLECLACDVLLSETEIRREADQASARAGGEIRVMTVHGAKGLEAPIVILPDTAGRKPPHAIGLIDDGEGGLLWKPRAKEDCEASRRALVARAAADQDEASRLLYVALTRARDRLIIAGIEGADSQRQGSWRQLAEAAFETLGADEFELEGGTKARRFGPAPSRAAAPAAEGPSLALPAWCAKPAPDEPWPSRSLAPSGMVGGGREPALSPLDRTEGLGRWRRGEIIHRLLQALPDLAPGQRRDAAGRFLAAEPDLSAEQRAEMAAAALGVLEDPQFAAVFGPGSKAEVALAGSSARLPAGVRVAGRMDRLVVEEERVLVVDFKTNRPAPARIEEADPAYIRQLAAYAGVLCEVFPGRRVETALLWTDGPSLMAVPENLIEAALDGMALIG